MTPPPARPVTRPGLRRGLWIASVVVIVISAIAITVAVRRGADDGGRRASDPVFRAATVMPDPLPLPTQAAPDTAGVSTPLATRPDAGHLSLLYFGYTHCPDVCPLDMASLAAALEELPEAQRAKIRVVFASVDPERDEPAALERWLAAYDPTFIGVTPPLAETNATLAKLGYAAVTTEPIPGSDGYAVSHPAGVYVYTPDGRAHVAFFGTNAPTDVANDLSRLLGGWDPSWVD